MKSETQKEPEDEEENHLDPDRSGDQPAPVAVHAAAAARGERAGDQGGLDVRLLPRLVGRQEAVLLPVLLVAQDVSARGVRETQ